MRRWSRLAQWSFPHIAAPFVLLLCLSTVVAAGPVSRAKELYEKGEYDKAIEILRTRVERRPGDYDAARLLGHCFMQKQDYTMAVTAYLKANSEKPPNIETNRYLGRAYLARGHYRSALDAYNMVLMRYPEDAEAHVRSGFARLNLQEYDQAIKHYETAWRVDNNQTVALINLARIYDTIKKDYVRALEYYEAFKSVEPDSNLTQEAETKIRELTLKVEKRKAYGLDVEDTETPDPEQRRLQAAGLPTGAKFGQGILLPLKGESRSEEELTAYGDFLRSSIFKRLRIVMLPSEDWRQNFEDAQQASKGSCETTACIIDVGRRAGVRYVFRGKFSSLGVKPVFTLEMFSTETGQLAGMHTTVHDPMEGGLTKTLDQTAFELLPFVLAANEAD